VPNQAEWGVRSQQLTQPPFAGPNDPATIIFPSPIPAELVAFYAIEGSTIVSGTLNRADATTYSYDLFITNPLFDGARVFGAVGGVGPTVSETMRFPFTDGSSDISIGARASVFSVWGTNSVLRLSKADLQFADFAGGQVWDAPRGPRGANYTTVGNAAASSGTEDAIDSASWDEEPEYEFADGRLYRATLVAGIALDSAVDSISLVRVRKGAQTTSGTVLILWQPNTSTAAATAVATVTQVGYFRNASGGTVTSKLSVTLTKGAGANQRLYGDGNIPLSLSIEDYGKWNQQDGLDAVQSL
jgi:hypothetical protein